MGGCDSDSSFWYPYDFGNLPFFILKPKLRIKDPHINFRYDVEKQNVLKEACITIYNTGKRDASKVRVQVNVCPIGFHTLDIKPFDVIPTDEIEVKLCQVKKDDKFVTFDWLQNSTAPFGCPVEIGHAYDLIIRFMGSNFSDRKEGHYRLFAETYEKFALLKESSLVVLQLFVLLLLGMEESFRFFRSFSNASTISCVIDTIIFFIGN